MSAKVWYTKPRGKPMTKKLKPKKTLPKGMIEFDKAYWDKLSKQGCQDGACELKPK